jgi:hypothetical protein
MKDLKRLVHIWLIFVALIIIMVTAGRAESQPYMYVTADVGYGQLVMVVYSSEWEGEWTTTLNPPAGLTFGAPWNRDVAAQAYIWIERLVDYVHVEDIKVIFNPEARRWLGINGT